MKSPLKKLRDFALRKHGVKTEAALECYLEENDSVLVDATKYMQELKDIKTRYEGLLTNGQIICGAAYDFSRSLNDMASYMVETFGESMGETGNAFGIMAQFQFEMSKLLEVFATHVSQAIISQTEQIMTEILHIQALGENAAESLKLPSALQSDDHRAKHLSRKDISSSAQNSIEEQSQGFYSHAKLFIQEEPNRLLKQAAKYHTAYMDFFSKGLSEVNAVEPKMKQLTEDNRINGILSAKLAESNMMQMADVQQPNNMGNASNYMLDCLESSRTSGELKPVKVKTNSFKAVPLFPKKQNGKTFNRTTSDKVSMYALPSPFRILAEQRNGTGSASSEKDANEDELSPVKGYYSGNVLEDYKTNQKSRASYHVKRPSYSVERSSRHIHSHSLDHFVPTQQIGSSMTCPGSSRSVTLERRLADQTRRHSHSGPMRDNSWSNSRINGNASPLSEGSIFPLSTSVPLNTTVTHSNFSAPQISELHKLPLPPSRTVSSSSLPVGNCSQEIQNPLSPLPQPPCSNRLVMRSLSTPSLIAQVHKCQYDKPE